MRRFFSWIARLFGVRPSAAPPPQDHLPGERARFKDPGATPQEQAWRKASAKLGDQGTGASHTPSGDLDRLLRKK